MTRLIPLRILSLVCPVSCPSFMFVMFLSVGWGRLLDCHSFSSVSAKADIRKRKITDDTLSPCLTPTSWSISAFSFPIFTVTLRSVYSLSMLFRNLGGAPYRSSIWIISLWL